MIKNISQLEIVIDQKIYQFLCPYDSPLEHVKFAIAEFTKYVAHVEENVRKNEEAQSACCVPDVDNHPCEDVVEDKSQIEVSND